MAGGGLTITGKASRTSREASRARGLSRQARSQARVAGVKREPGSREAAPELERDGVAQVRPRAAQVREHRCVGTSAVATGFVQGLHHLGEIAKAQAQDAGGGGGV